MESCCVNVTNARTRKNKEGVAFSAVLYYSGRFHIRVIDCEGGAVITGADA